MSRWHPAPERQPEECELMLVMGGRLSREWRDGPAGSLEWGGIEWDVPGPPIYFPPVCCKVGSILSDFGGGAVICRHCSEAIPDDSVFCLRCGSRQERVCPNCEKGLAPDAAFCSACGHDLSIASLEPGATAEAPSQTPAGLASALPPPTAFPSGPAGDAGTSGVREGERRRCDAPPPDRCATGPGARR